MNHQTKIIEVKPKVFRVDNRFTRVTNDETSLTVDLEGLKPLTEREQGSTVNIYKLL